MTLPSTSPTAAGQAEAPAWNFLLALAVGALGFFLPFSSAGVAFAEAALLVLVLFRPGVVARAQPWQEPVMAAGLLLLAYIAMHTLATSGWGRASGGAINKYQELVLGPLLFALLGDARHRRVFIRALIAGALLLAIVYWAAMLEPRLYAVLGKRRISAGFALAACAFLILLRADGRPHPWPARLLALFMALAVLFAIDSRTGHVVLVLLASCAAWLHSPRRWRWAAAIACPLLVLALGTGSHAVNSRLKETLANTQSAGPNGELTSTAIRIEMLRVARDMVARYAVTGAGFANYSVAYEQAALEHYRGEDGMQASAKAARIRTNNPHNEYLMQLISGGITALALYLAWLILPLWHASRAPRPLGGLLTGLVLAFAVGGLFNSLLMDFVEGHVYISLLAWMLAESRYGAAQRRGIGRVLVIATRQIGDVLLTTPLIHSARRRWPEARIEVLAFAGTAGMLRGNPDLDQIVEWPARPGWRGGWSLLRQCWRRYDLALVADPGDRAHLIGWIAAPLRSGIVPRAGGTNWIKRQLLAHAVTSAGDLGSVHVTAEKQALLAPWAPDDRVSRIVTPPPEPLPTSLRDAIEPGAVVIHAPSMWPYKQWPLAHFRRLVGALLADGCQVVLTGSAAPRDQECIAALRGAGEAPQLLDVSGQLNFSQLATLLQGAALYIGPDTSVSHLAAATGVPVIAILGPTNPQRWAPWPARADAQALFTRSAGVQQSGNVTVIQGRQPCVPCGRAGCEDHRQSRSDCLQSITPEQVLEQARKALGSRVRTPA